MKVFRVIGDVRVKREIRRVRRWFGSKPEANDFATTNEFVDPPEVDKVFAPVNRDDLVNFLNEHAGD